VNQKLPANRRYCRPWTALFLTDLARAYQAAFHTPLEVSSAVRTVSYQKRLMETNGNAAAAEGDVVSPHLTGAAVDLPKSNFSRQQIAWMRRRLLALQQAGKIDVEEEFQQSCFHITVYKNYLPVQQPSAKPASPAKAGTLRVAAHRAPAPAVDATETASVHTLPAAPQRQSAKESTPRAPRATKGSKPRPGSVAPVQPAHTTTKPAHAPAQPTEVIVEGL
jgi:hypothetical protein